MKKLILCLIVFLGVGGAGVARAEFNNLKNQTLCCTDPAGKWIYKVKLCGYSEVDNLSFNKCNEKGGDKKIYNMPSDKVACAYEVKAKTTNEDGTQTYPINFSYEENLAPAFTSENGILVSVGKNDHEGSVVFESTQNFIEEDKPVESPTVAGASTEKPDVEDPKIELLRQQVDILKAMIQLLLGKLEAMRGI